MNCAEASNSGIYMFYSKTTVKLFVCITGILLELFDIGSAVVSPVQHKLQFHESSIYLKIWKVNNK